MTGRRRSVLALASFSLIACSSNNGGGPSSSDDGGNGADVSATTDDGGSSTHDASQTVTQMVGASGGTVTAPGVVLTIPAGALSSDTQISVTTGGVPVPTGYVAVSPVYAFSPAGTTFAVPITVQITLTGSGTGASVFLSNATGGYDAVPTTSSTATTLSASVTHLGDCFAGEDAHDAAAQTDTGSSTDAGATADTGTPADTGPSSDTGSSSDAGISADTGTATDAATGSDTGSTTDAVASDAGTSPDTGGADAGTATDSAATEAGTTGDAATGDAGTPGIFVTVSGVATSFIYNVNAAPFQAWWTLSADDAPSGAHWTMTLIVPNTAGGPIGCGGAFPEITYTHHTATGDAGTADMTFTTNTTGGSCSITESTTAQTQGAHAIGTFSGSLWLQTDSGNTPSKSLTTGSYDIIVP